jgi:hypothetical protein
MARALKERLTHRPTKAAFGGAIYRGNLQQVAIFQVAIFSTQLTRPYFILAITTLAQAERSMQLDIGRSWCQHVSLRASLVEECSKKPECALSAVRVNCDEPSTALCVSVQKAYGPTTTRQG